MITPYTKENEVDYGALEAMIEWYINNGVKGLFAVCQSSEMQQLSLEERVSIARFVKVKSAGLVTVVASGHISDNLVDQIYELKAMRDTGIDALIIISNRLARKEESDEVWKLNAEKIWSAVSDIPLGIYECPYLGCCRYKADY